MGLPVEYVASMVTAETYPWEGTKEERAAWRAQRDDYVKMYKSARPGYHEAAKQYALEEAAEIRGEGDGYDDDDED